MEEGTNIRLSADLRADVGGGCNAETVSLVTSQVEDGDKITVTIEGHEFRSDGGPCTDLAEARGEVQLPVVRPGAAMQLDFTLGDSRSSYRIERSVEAVVLTTLEGGRVSLICSVEQGWVAQIPCQQEEVDR